MFQGTALHGEVVKRRRVNRPEAARWKVGTCSQPPVGTAQGPESHSSSLGLPDVRDQNVKAVSLHTT